MTFPDDALDLHLEVALGADPTSPQQDWEWTDITDDRLIAQPVKIIRGTSGEAGNASPMSVTLNLDNDDGALTPRHPSSVYYPHWKRGVPLRISVEGSDVFLECEGTPAAYTPEDASLSDTGDQFHGVSCTPHQTYGTNIVAGAWDGVNQDSWALVIHDGNVEFWWSTNGLNQRTASVPMPPMTVDGHLIFGASLDVNDAGFHRVQFYYQTDTYAPGEWVAWGNPTGDPAQPAFTVVQAMLTDLVIGHASFLGRVHAYEMRGGIDPNASTLVADPIFSDEPTGTQMFVDTSGNVWRLYDGKRLTNRITRFVGQVAEIVPSWPDGDLEDDTADTPGKSVVSVTAAGTLRRLGQGSRPLGSPLRRQVLSAENLAYIHAYWPMEDGPDSTYLESASGGLPITLRNVTPGAGADNIPGSLPGAAVSPDSSSHWTAPVLMSYDNPIFYGTPVSWDIEMYVTIPEHITTHEIFRVTTTGIWGRWVIELTPTHLNVTAVSPDGTTQTLDAAPVTWDPGPVHIKFAMSEPVGTTFWNLNVTPIATGVTTTVSGSYIGQIGLVVDVGYRDDVTPPGGISFSHLVVSSRIEDDWLVDAAAGWANEKAADRLARVCAENSIPLSIIGGAEDTPSMGVQTPETLGALLAECVAADIGIMADDRNRLGLTYITHAAIENQPRLVLDASAGDVSPGVAHEDDKAARNSVTVSRSSGTTFTASDGVASEGEGTYDTSVTLNLGQDVDIRDQAYWRLWVGTWPGMRYPEATIDLDTMARLQRWMLRDLGFLVEMTGLPSQHPPGSVVLLLAGYTETLDGVSASVVSNFLPGGPHVVGRLDDEVYGRLESDGSLIMDPIDETETTLVVGHAGHTPGWITTADFASEFPFDIMLGGERMTVTAIVGSPGADQTFTVVRSVNGVVRSHPEETDPLTLAQPMVLAL
jgi:hypothetical protein